MQLAIVFILSFFLILLPDSGTIANLVTSQVGRGKVPYSTLLNFMFTNCQVIENGS